MKTYKMKTYKIKNTKAELLKHIEELEDKIRHLDNAVTFQSQTITQCEKRIEELESCLRFFQSYYLKKINVN